MDGFDVLLRIKENVGTNNIPVIMLTCRSMKRDVGAGLTLGATEYVTKPFTPEDFVVLVKRVIAQNGM